MVARLEEHPAGYLRWRVWDPRRRGEVVCYVHQLVAIANGADPSLVFSGGDYHVHHRNGCKRDNRPDNLAVIPSCEHPAHTFGYGGAKRLSAGPTTEK